MQIGQNPRKPLASPRGEPERAFSWGFLDHALRIRECQPFEGAFVLEVKIDEATSFRFGSRLIIPITLEQLPLQPLLR